MNEFRPSFLPSLSRSERWLIVLFLLTLPLSNPWVRGDGVGYYAFARSLLIEHRLDFQKDWLQADLEFRLAHVDAQGQLSPDGYSATGHLLNHFAIGPAILWAPFLIAAHAGVLVCDALGAHIPADGFSKPYILAMTLGTAVYGFLALWISFRVARRYVPEWCALVATIGIWFASSLPVYMYFNPSWSHAQSAFMVALFVWYWNETRGSRTLGQWILLGLIAGLMLDVYYVSAILLLLPFFESLGLYKEMPAGGRARTSVFLVLNNVFFLCALLVAFLPTLITKRIIYGSFFDTGYTEKWFWSAPFAVKVALSAQHGLFSWTPIIALSILGLFLLVKRERILAIYSLVVFGVYLYVIGSYQNWHGMASFGNRFFISLTVFFILGLAFFFEWLAEVWNGRRARRIAIAATGALILWNFGMMYQWGTHLLPARGPISWRQAVYNQFAVVPGQAARTFERYLLRRSQFMERIEDEDMKQLKSHSPE